jgi:phage terminase large subunit-like protein
VIGRTTEQCRETCIEGESGLLRALDLRITSREYNRTTGEIQVGDGSVIYAYSAENPESLRGPNLSGAWCDELAAWHYEQTWTEGLMPALRIGTPRVLVTTTPRRTKLVRDLASRDDGSVVVTRGATFDNEANLSPQALIELRRRYEGTRIGRQELYGELLEDIPGALWSAATIESTRAVLVD